MYVFKALCVVVFFLWINGVAAADVHSGSRASCRTDSLLCKPGKPPDRWLAVDKGQHLLGSMIVTIGTSRAYQRFVHTNRDRARMVGVSFTFTLGAGKEIWDYFHPGHDASWKDLTADGLGIVLGWFILTLK